MSFWEEKRVTVTGGAGFLGSFVVNKLQERLCKQVFVPRSREYDLRNPEAIVMRVQQRIRAILSATDFTLAPSLCFCVAIPLLFVKKKGYGRRKATESRATTWIRLSSD